MSSSQDLTRLQEAARVREDARVARSSVWAVTPAVLLDDAREAVTGVVGDLYGTSSKKKTTAEVFLSGDRLRGLGAFMLSLAAAVAVVSRGMFES